MSENQYKILSDYDLKVVLIGDKSAGKSSLLLRYTENAFFQDFLPRGIVDVKYSYLNHRGVYTRFEIVFCMQVDITTRLNQSLVLKYCTRANGVFIVFDKSSRESFEKIDYWIEFLRTNTGENTYIALIGNKAELKSKVTRKEISSKAKKYGVTYFLTSALTGDRVSIAFEDTFKSCVDYALNDLYIFKKQQGIKLLQWLYRENECC